MLIGTPAPSLTLRAYFNNEFTDVALDSARGKWLVLFFYPLDFTFICPTEITAFSKRYDEFSKLDCEVLGASTDSEHSHKAWCQAQLGELRFPLLADKGHALSRAFDVLDEKEGTSIRATFIIDPEGIIRWANVHDNSVGRSVAEVLRALGALQTGELCPVDWTPGGKTLGKA
jgi:peroxiredoxin (alkyl hydroperoxide reductase subunit C)